MRTLVSLSLALFTILLVATSSSAEETATLLVSAAQVEPEATPFIEHSHEGVSLRTYNLTLTPKSPQPPVLRYRLLPAQDELVEGNAATQYHRAIVLMRQQTANMEKQKEFWEALETWREMSLEQLPIEEVAKALAPFESALAEARLGALRTHCDWGVPIQEMGRNLLHLTLDEHQQTQNLVRIATVRIRLHLAQGRWDAAIKDLQTGIAMARDAGDGSVPFSVLFGTSIGESHCVQLLTALTLEDAPNLYWSFTQLPDPLADLRSAVELDAALPFRMFPELLAARTEVRDEAYWNETLLDLIERFEHLELGSFGTDLESTARRAFVISHVPAARKALVEKFGYPAEEVAQMPGSRVLLIFSGHTFEAARDKQISLFGLPYYEAKPRFTSFQKDPADGLGVHFLLDCTNQFYAAVARNQRSFALLRTVEALRDFVATHDRVPQSLDEVTNLPIPINPLTGQPFGYRVEDAEARKVALVTGGEDYQVPTRLRITFRK